MDRPFWEYAYSRDTALPAAAPSTEIARLAEALPAGSRVLDVGCGAGRNALDLADRGFRVEGFAMNKIIAWKPPLLP